MNATTKWLVCAAAATGLATVASADTVSIIAVPESSTEGLGNFEGSITYNHAGGSLGDLIISLTNTTPASIGGFITAFVFNINSTDPNATATFVSGPDNFRGITNVNGQPFGNPFDAGATTFTGPDHAGFEGGGPPDRGLGVGETGVFTFQVMADDADELGAADFLTGPFDFNFVVRFRGMADDGSDKVPGIIPLPAPAALAATGLALMAASRRRRQN